METIEKVWGKMPRYRHNPGHGGWGPSSYFTYQYQDETTRPKPLRVFDMSDAIVSMEEMHNRFLEAKKRHEEQLEWRFVGEVFGIGDATAIWFSQNVGNRIHLIEYYENSFKMIRKKFPQVGVHGLSVSEIDTIAKVEKSSTKEVLSRLKDAGLQSLPGAGAEILNDQVKEIISPKKIMSKEWLDIMEEAHTLQIQSSATMMYGHVESNKQIAEHFEKIVHLQEKTNGFMAFIPWSFEPNNTAMQKDGTITSGAGGYQLLKMIAISRLVFDGLISHIQSSWLTNGVGMAQLALQYGADDFGGTLIGEEVVSCTGSRSTELTGKQIIDSIHQIGFEVEERDNFYQTVCNYQIP